MLHNLVAKRRTCLVCSTIYYDRLILGLWKRAEGAIYKRFADNPEKFRCEVLEGPADNPEHKQFRKNDIVSIEIGLDFGGNQSGHSFVARGYTDDYRDVMHLNIQLNGICEI